MNGIQTTTREHMPLGACQMLCRALNLAHLKRQAHEYLDDDDVQEVDRHGRKRVSEDVEHLQHSTSQGAVVRLVLLHQQRFVSLCSWRWLSVLAVGVGFRSWCCDPPTS